MIRVLKEQDENRYWVWITLDIDYKKGLLVGFITEKEAEDFIYMAENFTDYTVFSAELYGYTTQSEAYSYYSYPKYEPMDYMTQENKATPKIMKNILDWIYRTLK